MNRWNEFIYKLWAPLYDRFFNSGRFLAARKKVFQEEVLTESEKILFVGVGTGADLELIDYKHLDLTAIDYSNDMLEKAKEKFRDTSIRFIKMDAQQMNFKDNEFDVVIGSLILSVVPNADQCLREMIRVTKPGGKLIIFDKFSPKDKPLSPFKKIMRPLIRLLGTDIGVNFERIYKNNEKAVSLKEDSPIMFKGMYRKIVISKKGPH